MKKYKFIQGDNPSMVWNAGTDKVGIRFINGVYETDDIGEYLLLTDTYECVKCPAVIQEPIVDEIEPIVDEIEPIVDEIEPIVDEIKKTSRRRRG